MLISLLYVSATCDIHAHSSWCAVSHVARRRKCDINLHMCLDAWYVFQRSNVVFNVKKIMTAIQNI